MAVKLLTSITPKCFKASTSYGNKLLVASYYRQKRMMHEEGNKILNINSMNPQVKTVEYAVRGKIVIRASELQEELYHRPNTYFDKVIKANIGDCHATGQKPITFLRQMLACCSYPELFEKDLVQFPMDVVYKSRNILDSNKRSVGCYSDSEGIPYVRQKVAEYINKRDCLTNSRYEADFRNIYMLNGASSGVRTILYTLIDSSSRRKSGIMLPIPQYPLYSAVISECSGNLVPYYLNEADNWSLDVDHLQESLQNHTTETCNPTAIVIINPGNPTGQVLSVENIKQIIKFCVDNKLVCIADEVYQENVYVTEDPRKVCVMSDVCDKFNSFRKVLSMMDDYYQANLELISFHSASKGYHGECGIRGGYMELHNIDDEVKKQIVKLLSTQLGSTTAGQVIMCGIVDPPVKGDPSYELFNTERSSVLLSLKKRSQIVSEELNSIEKISCNPIQGAMYAFPKLHLTNAAIEAAQKVGMQPDEFFCFKLLEATGICVVPGSGFGQEPNTYHFRTTILPQVDDINFMVKKIRMFCDAFFAKYAD